MSQGVFQSEKTDVRGGELFFSAVLTDRAAAVIMNPATEDIAPEIAYIINAKLNETMARSERLRMPINVFTDLEIEQNIGRDNTYSYDIAKTRPVWDPTLAISCSNYWSRITFSRPNIVKLESRSSYIRKETLTPEVVELTKSLLKTAITESVREIEQHTPESIKSVIPVPVVDKSYETIVIPKGTLLFRGIHDMNYLTSAFAGVKRASKGPGAYCLGINHRVFFYPYPFVADLVSNYKHIIMFVTTRDMTLVRLMSPSKHTYHKRSAAVRNCGDFHGCHLGEEHANPNDPCINYDIVSNNVTGIVGIFGTDTTNLEKHPPKYLPYFNKYFTTFTDSLGGVGLPEVILHPRQIPNVKELIKGDTVYPQPWEYNAIHGKGALQKIVDIDYKIDDFKTWYSQNKSEFNYIYLHVMDNDYPKIQGLMDAFMSEGGLDLGDDHPYHLKMNRKNGMFQIVEFSNNHGDLIAPDFSVQTTDLIRKDIYPLSTTGASRSLRRTTLRRRLLKSR
jgi:hypothetical protein